MPLFSYFLALLGDTAPPDRPAPDPVPSATQTVTPRYRFPASDLDRPDTLLALVGSFWDEIYQGQDLVRSLLAARAQLAAQEHLDFLELIAALNRFTVPVFHRANWTFLPLRESARNQTTVNLPRYDGTATYAAATPLRYGEPTALTTYHCWTLPEGLVAVPVLLNRLTAASLTWTAGVDFLVRDGVLMLREDPFTLDNVAIRELFVDNVAVDREAGLWVYRGQFDRGTVHQQFGYVLGRPGRSSVAYRDWVNAVFDGLVTGTTERVIQDALAAVCDVPRVREPYETVEAVFQDNRFRWIVTDGHAYRFHRDAAVLVAPGDVVRAGDPLVDVVQIYEFTQGTVPPPTALPALAVGGGFLAAGYHQDLVFTNTAVPLEVATAADGYTRVEFALGGLPGDIARFWDEIHAAGVARGQTLAMLLDRRTVKTGQPTARALPATINPLEFLCGNLFRAHLTVAVLRPGQFGPDALGLSSLRLLRKLIPPQTALIVLATLAIGGDTITMEGPGDETTPGYTEAVAPFFGHRLAEALDPATQLEETIRLQPIRGRCV